MKGLFPEPFGKVLEKQNLLLQQLHSLRVGCELHVGIVYRVATSLSEGVLVADGRRDRLRWCLLGSVFPGGFVGSWMVPLFALLLLLWNWIASRASLRCSKYLIGFGSVHH